MKTIQTVLLFLLTAAALTIVFQNYLILQQLNRGSLPEKRLVSEPLIHPIDVRIVEVEDEIDVNIESINNSSIFGNKLPVKIE